MKLDYNASKGAFLLFVEPDAVDALRREHDMDVSGTPGGAVLFTRCPYTAASFAECAEPRAAAVLAPLLAEIQASRAVVSNAKFPVPPDKELWPYQKAALEYSGRRQNTMIGLDVGCGKTATAIVKANTIGAKRVLVVAPAGLRKQWEREILAWSTIPRVMVQRVMAARDGVSGLVNWTVVSYDLLRSSGTLAALKRMKFDMMILDESHYIKTAAAGRTKAFIGEHGLSAPVTLLLSGTPIMNRPREIWTQARIADHGSIDWATEQEFCSRFNPSAVVRRRGRVVASQEAVLFLPELQNRLRSHFMYRVQKRDVLHQLPPVRHEIHYLQEDGGIRAALAAERLLDIDPMNLSGATAEILGHVSEVRRQMGMAMAPQVAEHVVGLLEGGLDKVFVTCWHTDVFDYFHTALRSWGVVGVCGSTPPGARDRAIMRFIEDPATRVFLGQIKAVGTGTDGLQKVCSHIVVAEPDWTPATIEQAVGRLERAGQKNAVFAQHMAVDESLGAKVLITMLNKLPRINSALDQKISVDGSSVLW